MNNFGCALAVKCHCRYFVRLPATKFRIWLFLAYCIAVRRLLVIIVMSKNFVAYYDRLIGLQTLGCTVLWLIAYSDCCIARFTICDSMQISCII